jgi:hypothetical protein
VKANQGAAGVDGQSIADFEADLSNNLYELWNRLSSGRYFPPPVRRAEGGWRYAPVGHSNGRGPSRPGSCPSLPGAAFGAGVRCRLPWLEARQIGDRRRAPSSSALLALRLGARSRRKRPARLVKIENNRFDAGVESRSIHTYLSTVDWRR